MPLKDQNLENYYNEIAEMCSSKGWKYFLENINEMKVSYNDVLKIKDANDFYRRQGQLDILLYVSKYKEMHETAYDAILAEESEDA